MAATDEKQTKYVDPAVKDFEAGLKALHGGKTADAKKRFEKVIANSEQSDLTMRARSYLKVCEQRAGKVSSDDLDPFTEAVMARNQGDLDSALEIAKGGGRWAKDARFALLAASIFASRDEGDEAMGHLNKAIELDPASRVQAYHDADFDPIREREDFQALYASE